MQKILVACETDKESREIKQVLDSHLPYQVYIASGLSDVEAQLKSKVFNLVIIKIDVFEAKDYMFIKELRDEGLSVPILTMADNVRVPRDYYFNENIHLHFLTKPFSEKNMLGLTRKLLKQKNIPKQKYRRFNTNQIAQVETLSDGSSILMSMYNLSKGGVYCEFDSGTAVSVGDLIRVKIILSDTNSEHNVNAKVVWMTPKGRFSGRQGLGCRFITAKDGYKALLDGL